MGAWGRSHQSPSNFRMPTASENLAFDFIKIYFHAYKSKAQKLPPQVEVFFATVWRATLAKPPAALIFL
jgi:hypothetical protein